MRKLQAFEATGLKDSRPSRGNPVNPVPTNVTGGILAAQDSTGIPIPVPCEHCSSPTRRTGSPSLSAVTQGPSACLSGPEYSKLAAHQN